MDEVPVNIKVFSDSNDVVSITSALKQLSLKGIPINFTFPEYFMPEDNDIIVLQLESMESLKLKDVITVRRKINNKILIIIRNADVIETTSLESEKTFMFTETSSIKVFLKHYEVFQVFQWLFVSPLSVDMLF